MATDISRGIVTAAVLLWTGAAWAGGETALHDFSGGADGALPWSNVVFDTAGTMYGTTQAGGTFDLSPGDGYGTVFALSPTGQVTALHEFTGGTRGQATITGLTLVGGTLLGSSQSTVNGGLLYSLRTDGSGFSVLHEFSGAGGYRPVGLLVAAAGTVYGLTLFGGLGYTGADTGNGVLFGLQRDGSFQVVHAFTGGADGREPNSLLADAAGNLFGSTGDGGAGCSRAGGCGAVFEYAPATGTFTILHGFGGGADGTGPNLGSIGPDGTLYGTTFNGSVYKRGSLFALTPSGGGYTFSTLASFPATTSGEPVGGPILVPNGALVGATTSYLYAYQDGRLRRLAMFDGGQDGSNPQAGPTFGPNAALYGTAYGGGLPCTTQGGVSPSGGCGIVYKYTLP